MIFYGSYRINWGAYRPFIPAWVYSSDAKWVKFSFLVDTGADETFLHHRSIAILGIEPSHLEVRNDVGGVGGFGIPYFRWETRLKILSADGAGRLFTGEVNVFLDPHASRVPILGRDVLDNFAAMFDRRKAQIALIEAPDRYQIIRGSK